MLLKHPSYADKAIIIVEGGSDIRLFRSLLNSEKFKIESAEGKVELSEIINDLQSDYENRLVGLRDADHDRILCTEPEAENIIITDLHDAEMMMLSSPSLDNFVNEYAVNENHDVILSELRNSVFDAAYFIGVARLINEIKDLKLNFKSLSFSGFVSVNKLEVIIDKQALLGQLIARSPNKPGSLTESLIMEYIESEIENEHCRLQACSGHDVTKLIGRVFSQSWASVDRNLNQPRVEAALRLGYSREMFMQTGVYEELKRKLGSSAELLSPNKSMKVDAA